jgi:hypothetical protein
MLRITEGDQQKASVVQEFARQPETLEVRQ